jgi:Glycosyl hydrolases family 18/Concanavalin A-like lectin/glucanases superfamily/Bacterial Ig domain/Putative Ig domain
LKNIGIILLSSVGLYGQWITGYYAPGGGPTGEPVSAIPWNKYTHMQFWAAGAANTNDGKVCLGYLTQTDINNFLANKPAGKKALVTLTEQNAGATAPDNRTCGGGSTWAAVTGPGTISAFVQNIVNFVNQVGQNNGGFDGVDLDWESGLDMTNYTQLVDLINRLRAAMPTKVITMYVFPGPPTATAAAAQSSLDQVNVGCYDDGNFATWSWYNGPLYTAVVNNGSSCNDTMFQQGHDNGAVAAGVARSKIGVGIPFYGYRWSGCTQAMVSGCTRQNYFSYGLLVGDTTRWQSQYQRYDSTYKSNYLSIPGLNEFDTYNGVEFMTDVAAWAKSNGFGGFMTFGQHDEYVSNQTGDARYPLSTALYSAVFGAGGGGGTGSAPTVTSSSLPAGTVGSAYSATLTATGATSIGWSLSAGSLPTGLSLNSSTGAITGTPTTAATSNFTVQATNTANNLSSTKALSITINAGSPSGTSPVISTSSLPAGTVGSAYSQTLTATGSTPITWGPATISLPAGLSWNASTATISGTPTAAASGTYTFTATNAFGTATKAFSLVINGSTPPASSGPFAYWKLDDGSGATVSDSSGNGSTVNLFNSPSWLTGANCVASSCLSFNGTNQYGAVALNLSDTSAVTLSFWMNWTSYANDDRLAFEFSPDFNGVATGFMVDPNSSYNGGGQFEVGFQGDGGYNQVLFARPTPGWHHYAFVFNKGAAADNEVTPYVDGVAVPYTKPTNSENTNNFGSDTLYFMSRGGSSLPGGGLLDEVQLYKQALNASQVQTLATAFKAPVQAPDTTPPTVSITSPQASEIVNRGSQFTFSVNASDDVGVVSVQYALDGANLGSPVTTAPFSMAWTATSRGWHNLTAMASDAAGNTTTSAPVRFRVR